MDFNRTLTAFIDTAKPSDEITTQRFTFIKLNDSTTQDDHRFVLLHAARVDSMQELLILVRQQNREIWETVAEVHDPKRHAFWSFPRRDWIEPSLIIIDEYYASQSVFK